MQRWTRWDIAGAQSHTPPAKATTPKWPTWARPAGGPTGEKCSGLRGSRLYRIGTRQAGCRRRRSLWSSQTSTSQAGLCASAQTMGRGELLCMGGALPPSGTRLRAISPPPCPVLHWLAFVSLMLNALFYLKCGQPIRMVSARCHVIYASAAHKKQNVV